MAGSLNNVAAHLSAVGQFEAALDRAEAVELYRSLAAALPDVFTPDLSRSLSMLGDMFEATNDLARAVALDREAIAKLATYFLTSPAVFAEAILVYIRDYMRRADLAAIKHNFWNSWRQFLSSFRKCPKERTMSVEPVTAAAAVALIVPYLTKMGEAAAEKAGEASADAAGKVLAWMRRKLTGHAQEALEDLQDSPESEDDQADLRKQLAKMLKADPTLLRNSAGSSQPSR